MRINPKLAGLEWFEVNYPTPFGNINVQTEKNGENVRTKISGPPEIEIISTKTDVQRK